MLAGLFSRLLIAQLDVLVAQISDQIDLWRRPGCVAAQARRCFGEAAHIAPLPALPRPGYTGRR